MLAGGEEMAFFWLFSASAPNFAGSETVLSSLSDGAAIREEDVIRIRAGEEAELVLVDTV